MGLTDLVPIANVTLMRRGVPVMGEREARLLEAVERVHSIKDARASGDQLSDGVGAIQVMERAFGGRSSNRAPAAPAGAARR